jgi:selenocysteine-specific elongation factor
MPIVGTAGHVDHGKSTLVRAITGRDPDRWREEKERGLTIDLGFAWSELEPGLEVSFVDVPGHERFAKNMLAGIEAIDSAIFVVAADEGWMPQSEEHLAVLDLLEVRRGVVALTKVDRVDKDLAELATLEVSEHLEGTTLEGIPIVPVSAPEGRGLDELRRVLADGLRDPVRRDRGRPRLWVDRSFSVPGAGTVVTGSLLDGAMEVGMRVEIHPTGGEARVRGIQSHERDLDRVEPGRRVALALAGVDREDVPRGSLVAVPGQWRTSGRILASVRAARYTGELSDRGAYHLHTGSGAWPARIRLLQPDLAVVDLAEDLPLAAGDRFILRETGRRLVVGGGRVLDPSPPSRSRQMRTVAPRLRASLDGTADDRASALLDIRGAETPEILDADSGGGTVTGVRRVGSLQVTDSAFDRLVESARELVTEFHQRHPLRPGIPLASLAAGIGVEPGAVETITAHAEDLSVVDATVRSSGHGGERTPDQEAAWERARARIAEDLSVPDVTDLDLDPELRHSLAREGELVLVGDRFAFLPDQISGLVEVMRSFGEPFSVSEFRERAGLSRKYAVPLLEWADDEGITVRMGDRRRLRN